MRSWIRGRRRLSRARERRRPLVRFYTRAPCTLCVRVEAELRRWARRYHFEIVRIDIDEDPALQARYLVFVPVTVVGAAEFHYELDEAAFAAALTAAQEERREGSAAEPPTGKG